MPDLEDYLTGFGIHENLEIAGYILKEIQSTHTQVVRYKEYAYSITMTFYHMTQHTKDEATMNMNANQLVMALKQMTAGTKIINSHYGNPYQCDFGIPTIQKVYLDGHVVISTMGHSYRV